MRVSLILVFLLFVSTCCLASAQTVSGEVQVFPTIQPTGKPGFSRQSGLQLTVDSRWAGNRGYRPLRVTLTSPKKTTSETRVTIVLRAGTWGMRNGHISVKKDFRLPQGVTETTVTLLVPQYIDWHTLGQEVWIDGKKDDDLSVDQNYLNSLQKNNNNGSSVLILADKAESKTIRDLMVMDTEDVSTQSQWVITGMENSITMPAKKLPQSWLAYSSLSMVISTTAELENCASQNPHTLKALLRWVRSGGNLWVMDVGEKWERLPEVETTLQLNPGRQASDKTKNGPEARGWRVLSFQSAAFDPENSLLSLEPLSSSQLEAQTARQASQTISPEKALDSRPWFVARAYGLGTITAFRYDFRSGWFNKNDPLQALARTHFAELFPWKNRHGNDPSTGNPDFYNLQVPGVGQAPVLEFQLLITLFVIVIGPVNYWLLKRWRRLPMLLVTVPAAAAISTVLLFAYGLLSDGLETRVRARSFTLLDQRAGEAVCWGRLSYYAGLAPRGGLQMPIDTALYPILPYWEGSYSYSHRYAMQQREMHWAENQQLTHGWLAARTPTQYQTITARPTSKKLLLRSTGNELHVTNQLGVEVLALLVRDHDGNVYQHNKLAIDESARLSPSKEKGLKAKLRKLISENEPQMPVDADFGLGNFNGPVDWSPYGTVSMQSSLMETQLRTLVLSGNKTWGPGSYIAITAQGVCLSLGLDEAREEASFHAIRGTW